MTTYTDAQLEAGILNALKVGDVQAAVEILEALGAQNLDRAVQIYDAMQDGLAYARVAAILEGSDA